MRGLHEEFWEHLHPEIDDGDLDGRANAVSGMDRQVSLALRDVPVTGLFKGAAYSYHHYLESTQFDIPENIDHLGSEEKKRAEATRKQAAEEGRITGEDWRSAKAATPRAFYESTHALLEECWVEFTALVRAIDEKFGWQAPGMGGIKKFLEDARSLTERAVKEKRAAEGLSVAGPAGGPAAAEERSMGIEGEVTAAFEPPGAAAAAGQIRSRQAALKRLAEAADYFRQNEPHSPVWYLVQRAISWGEMPLEVWLAEVVKNEGELKGLRETLGIKPSPETK
jgi:type VI secretion system protein ImpA